MGTWSSAKDMPRGIRLCRNQLSAFWSIAPQQPGPPSAVQADLHRVYGLPGLRSSRADGTESWSAELPQEVFLLRRGLPWKPAPYAISSPEIPAKCLVPISCFMREASWRPGSAGSVPKKKKKKITRFDGTMVCLTHQSSRVNITGLDTQSPDTMSRRSWIPDFMNLG